MSEASDLSQLLASGFAVTVIKVCKTNRSNKYCKAPAKHHGEYFHHEHEYSIHKEHIISHDKTDDALVDKTRVRVKKSIDRKQRDHVELNGLSTIDNCVNHDSGKKRAEE